jgi:hypothetical protein
VRIGIQVTQDAAQRRLVVQTVTPNSAADGILRPNDAIVGCNRKRFATSQPVDEMARGLAERPNPRWIELLIEREGLVRLRRIALPFVDPVEVLRRLTAVGRVLQRVTYLDTVPDEAGTHGYLTLEMRAGDQPLYHVPPVATRPAASQPTEAAPAGGAPALPETAPAVPPPPPAESQPAPAASQPAVTTAPVESQPATPVPPPAPAAEVAAPPAAPPQTQPAPAVPESAPAPATAPAAPAE